MKKLLIPLILFVTLALSSATTHITRAGEPGAGGTVPIDTLLLFPQVLGESAPDCLPGEICGAVTDANGDPLDNIAVEASRYTLFPGDVYIWMVVSSTTTDVNGRYQLPVGGAASYRIGFHDQRQPRLYSSEYYQDKALVEVADDVNFAAGAALTGIDAQLGTTGQISGQVTDKESNPIGGVRINTWQRAVDEAGHVHLKWSPEATTDENGQYQLPGLNVGAYIIRFEDSSSPRRFADEYYNNIPIIDINAATPISVTSGENLMGIDVQLADSSHITGHVSDENGGPLAGTTVIAIFNRIFPASYATTDADGAYDLVVNPGPYAVLFTGPDPYLAELYDNHDPYDLANAPLIDVGWETTVANIDAQLALSTTVASDMRENAVVMRPTLP